MKYRLGHIGRVFLVVCSLSAPLVESTASELLFDEIRASIQAQPRTFDNDVLFAKSSTNIVRSANFVETSSTIGDFDGDGDVDIFDYNAAQICFSFSGPGLSTPTACRVFDSDGDTDVDLIDTAFFWETFTGSLSGVVVEAGGLVPILQPVGVYYSGEPNTSSNNALNGIAAQAGYTQADLWYEWSVVQQPPGSGAVIMSNRSRPQTAFSLLPQVPIGEYEFSLLVTNLITLESGIDSVSLYVGECFQDADCNDGAFCNGLEMCDAVNLQCMMGINPCSGSEDCNESSDLCVGSTCLNSADCNDGLYCTGIETCVGGFCIGGTDPCGIGLSCDEFLQSCIDPQGATFLLTLGTDSGPGFTGTAAGDVFLAPLIFNAPTGMTIASLQSGDILVGGQGDDLLVTTLAFGTPTTIAPTIAAIENIRITDLGSGTTTLGGTFITGASKLSFRNGLNTNGFVLTNFPNVVDLEFLNNFCGLSLSYASGATNGANDKMAIELSNVPGGTLTIATATSNGIEAIDIVSQGTSNLIDAMVQVNGTTLDNITVEGSGPFSIANALPTSVEFVDASLAEGSVEVTIAFTGNAMFFGGLGNDTVRFGGTYATGDIINGGTGINTLAMSSSQAVGASGLQANVSNIQVIAISDGLAGQLVPSNFGLNLQTVQLEAGFNGGSLSLLSGTTVDLGKRGSNNDSTTSSSVTVSGGGILDNVTYNVNDSDHMASTFMGVETLNLTSNNDLDGTAADGGANTFSTFAVIPTVGALTTVNISGAANLTFTGSITANVINASSFTGSLTMSATTAGAISIIGGSGNDTIFGTAGADSMLSGGSGNDQIFGQAGNDNITTGSGNDIISMVIADVADIVTDFTPGSDKFDWNTALSSTDASVTLPAGTGAFQSAAGGTPLAVTTTVFELTGTTVVSQTAASVVTALGTTATLGDTNANILFIVYTTGGGGAIWNWINTDADVEASELTRVVTFTTLTADSLGATDFQ